MIMRRVITASSKQQKQYLPIRNGSYLRHQQSFCHQIRFASSTPEEVNSNNNKNENTVDVIIGVYQDGEVTATAKRLLSTEFLSSSYFKGTKWESGKVRLLHHSTTTASSFIMNEDALSSINNNNHKNHLQTRHQIARIAFVGLGEKNNSTPALLSSVSSSSSSSKTNQIFAEQFSQENPHLIISQSIRSTVSNAIQALTKDDQEATQTVLVDDFDSNACDAIAEALNLQVFKFDVLKDLKDPSKKKKKPSNYQFSLIDSNKNDMLFTSGTISAESQNFARYLGEMPANYMTPTIFCDTVSNKFNALNNENVQVKVYDRQWAENKQMNSFLSVARGSAQEPKVLEITYRGNTGSDELELCMVGKGITFDSGGISLKPGAGMKDMRGDMGGAATTVSALYGIAKMRLPINVTVVCMLCENMPGPDALKPGDVIQAMNKVTIEVDNTDAEGRLILADGLCYASEMQPKRLIDVATLTGACVIALGNACTGVYTTTNETWKQIEAAGSMSNDFMWRMPLFIDIYKKQLKSSTADLNNIGGREAGSCTAATFLSSFVDFDKVQHWAHLDIAGTFMDKDSMTGRPTRALIQYAKQIIADRQ